MSNIQTGLLLLVLNNDNTRIDSYNTNNLQKFNNNNNNYKLITLRISDTISEIFIHINLPELPNNLIYKNNLVSKIIKKIQISLNDCYSLIEINSKNLNLLLDNYLENYSDKLLFRNLPLKVREKLSKKGVTLILPLKIGNFLNKFNELISANHTYDINILLNEALENYFEENNFDNNLKKDLLSNINLSIKIIGTFYGNGVRHELIANSIETINDQIIKN